MLYEKIFEHLGQYMSLKSRTAIIGGGAAGFFCAAVLSEQFPGMRVCIFEKSPEVLSKVKISGGGRCNVTHSCYEPEKLAGFYPRGAKELRWAFERFQPLDTVQWFSERGVELKTEADGRIFPVSDKSQTIIDCLTNQCTNNKVDIRCGRQLTGFSKTSDGKLFRLEFSGGTTEEFDYLVIATGGNSGIWEMLEKNGISVVSPVPSLFALKTNDAVFNSLSGVSVPDAELSAAGMKFKSRGAVLITHQGFSGPAVLKFSSFAARELYAAEYNFALTVNWLPSYTREKLKDVLETLRVHSAGKLVHKNSHFGIPLRLWCVLLGISGINEDAKWSGLSNALLLKFAEQLTASRFQADGRAANKDEFVTCGGVSLKEVNFKTMESKKIRGLFFAGEVLDIDGLTGGFNFQSAWTTGFIAGAGIAAAQRAALQVPENT